MKKALLLSIATTMALSITAGDIPAQNANQNSDTSTTLIAKKSKTKKSTFHKGWYTAIGTCNLRYGPGTNYSIAYQIEDGEPVYVVKKKGNWYGLHHGSSDETIYWTHVSNLKPYYGPVTWS